MKILISPSNRLTSVHCKIARLAADVCITAPSPMVRILYHQTPSGQKPIAYLGFTDPHLADQAYTYLVEKTGKYSRSQDAGICRPRKAKRVDDATIEIKWHRPQVNLLHQFIEKDLRRSA